MKVKLTVEVGDQERRALAWRYGLKGKATRAALLAMFHGAVISLVDETVERFNRDPEARRKRARTLDNLGPGLGMRR
jgi:hypothetical protein